MDRLDAHVEVEAPLFSTSVELLGTLPGLGSRTAWVILAEAGLDMALFPSAAHLASWAELCPGIRDRAAQGEPGHRGVV